MYESYYLDQSGSGLDVFGKHALKTGLEIANDVADGESLKESTDRRVPEGIKRFATTDNIINQSGGGQKHARIEDAQSIVMNQRAK